MTVAVVGTRRCYHHRRRHRPIPRPRRRRW
jgi:hypothetical protein